jgi:hypothetical protein
VTPTVSEKLVSEIQKDNEYLQVPVRCKGSEKIAAKDFISNNEARTIRVYACTPVKEIRSRLETIKDENRLSKSIQIHHIL